MSRPQMQSVRGSPVHACRAILPYSKSVPEKRENEGVPATYEGDYISRARLEYLPGGRRDRRVKQNVKLSIFHEQSIISSCIIGHTGWCIVEMSRARVRMQTENADNLPPISLSYVRYAVTWLMIMRG